MELFNTKISVFCCWNQCQPRVPLSNQRLKKKCFGPKLNLQNIEELRNYKLKVGEPK
jgi:hypothetical protein